VSPELCQLLIDGKPPGLPSFLSAPADGQATARGVAAAMLATGRRCRRGGLSGSHALLSGMLSPILTVPADLKSPLLIRRPTHHY
jgi:hypothetical protein